MPSAPSLFRLLVSAVAVAGLTGSPAVAEDWGPAEGVQLLGGLTAKTPDGETVQLETLAGEGAGLVVAFVRSADWCPFCQRQLIGLSKRHEDFASRGLTLVSVSYDSPEILKDFEGRFDIAFTMLSDPESKIIDAFGIRNERQQPGSSGYGIPHPGIMIFDASGTLVLKFAEKGYRKRPKVDDVLAAFDGAHAR